MNTRPVLGKRITAIQQEYIPIGQEGQNPTRGFYHLHALTLDDGSTIEFGVIELEDGYGIVATHHKEEGGENQ